MRKTNAVICLLIAITGIAGKIQSQEKTIFMVAGQGCPANCADEFSPHYPVHLFKVSGKKLEKVYDISTGNEFVFKIGQYNAFKKVIIYKSEFFVKKKSFIIIDYKHNIEIDTITRLFPDETFSDFTYYLVYKDDPYIIFEHCKDIVKKRKERFYYGISLQNCKDTLFDNKIVQHLHSEGEQGLALVESTADNSEIMKIRTKVIDNKPFYYILYPRLYGPDMAIFTIPKLDEIIKKFKYIAEPDEENNVFRVFPLVNNDLIMIGAGIDFNEKTIKGNHKMEIYKKQFNKWDSHVFSGIFENAFRQINDWIVGYEAYSYSLGFYQKMSKYGSIPGKKFRKDTSAYGKPFDERAIQYKLDPEGVLYIYNIETGKNIEWEALEQGERQGDSEVLYIEDEMVYYRINDKLYKAKIINGEKLGKSELIVRDDRIRDVHWLFLAYE